MSQYIHYILLITNSINIIEFYIYILNRHFTKYIFVFIFFHVYYKHNLICNFVYVFFCCVCLICLIEILFAAPEPHIFCVIISFDMLFLGTTQNIGSCEFTTVFQGAPTQPNTKRFKTKLQYTRVPNNLFNLYLFYLSTFQRFIFY